MTKVIIISIIIYSAFHSGILLLLSVKKTEMLHLTKLIGYSILCTALTILTLATIVAVF